MGWKCGNSCQDKWNELLQQDLIRLPHWIELTLSVFFIQFYDIPSPAVVRAVILKPRGTRFSSRDGLTASVYCVLVGPYTRQTPRQYTIHHVIVYINGNTSGKHRQYTTEATPSTSVLTFIDVLQQKLALMFGWEQIRHIYINKRSGILYFHNTVNQVLYISFLIQTWSMESWSEQINF